jgi:hypothetical protein
MRTGGSVSAGVLAVVLVGALGGAVVGLIVGSQASNQAVIALAAAFVAGVLALIVGHVMFGNQTRLSPSSSVVVWNLVLASLIGALAGHELAVDIRSPPVSTMIGTISGLIAAVLIASTLVTIVWARAHPDNA